MMTSTAFRKFHAQQEQMIRAAMPRTNAADPAPLPAFAADRPTTGNRWSLGRRYVQKDAFTLAEVAHA